MSYSLYGTWSIEDAKSVGKKFLAKAKSNYGYEHAIEVGRHYKVEVVQRILPMSPLCKGTGKGGKQFECHLERFEKVEAL